MNYGKGGYRSCLWKVLSKTDGQPRINLLVIAHGGSSRIYPKSSEHGAPVVTHGNPALGLESAEHNFNFVPLLVKVFIIRYWLIPVLF